MSEPELHVLVDRLALAEAALAVGAPVIQVRPPDRLSDRAWYELALGVTRACVARGARCIVNDRVDIALAVGAHGVHVGADDLPVEVVRRLVGPAFIVGGTARDPERAQELVADGASYLGVGPAFATTSKTGLPDPIGPEGVRKVAEAVYVPVIAIGGITAARVPEVMATGARGVAVIGAVANTTDPGAAVRQLLMALEVAASHG